MCSFEFFLSLVISSLLLTFLFLCFFFFNDTATTEIYTLSLHDALPICSIQRSPNLPAAPTSTLVPGRIRFAAAEDRKSTRLNSSHMSISYAVFCLKKKNVLVEAVMYYC